MDDMTMTDEQRSEEKVMRLADRVPTQVSGRQPERSDTAAIVVQPRLWSTIHRDIAMLTFPNYIGGEISIEVADHVERRDERYHDWIVDLAQIEQAGPNTGSHGHEVIPLSSSISILPGQSVEITARPRSSVFRCGRLVISNAGTPGGAADWIVNDIRIGHRTQFLEVGDLPGDMFATGVAGVADAFVSFEPAPSGTELVLVVTYIGVNEAGAPFFASMVGADSVDSPHYVRVQPLRRRTTIPLGFAYVSQHVVGVTIYIPPIDQATIDVAVDATLAAGEPTPVVITMIGEALDGRVGLVRDVYVALVAQLAGALSSAEAGISPLTE